MGGFFSLLKTTKGFYVFGRVAKVGLSAGNFMAGVWFFFVATCGPVGLTCGPLGPIHADPVEFPHNMYVWSYVQFDVVPGTLHVVPSTQHLVPSIQYLVYLVPSTWCLVPIVPKF